MVVVDWVSKAIYLAWTVDALKVAFAASVCGRLKKRLLRSLEEKGKYPAIRRQMVGGNGV